MGHYIPELNHWEEDIVIFVAQCVRLGDISVDRALEKFNSGIATRERVEDVLEQMAEFDRTVEITETGVVIHQDLLRTWSEDDQ
ncbi:hypothetical protein F6A13_03605 [Acidithiobacillus sp. 'AMD consortium']|uniref:hypothetical protein n=1 Tax=Acidithiobacillus sp. 'AMD consortium' TaxID=2614801 RepID=UPI00124F5CBA|nr:hypothetical protein [Acidithiobacillus sp. 'AMD consortium']QFG77822.1 hypothetical protein F6A13_03605 [Acidithiobacillus sp. 'AMD consortium']